MKIFKSLLIIFVFLLFIEQKTFADYPMDYKKCKLVGDINGDGNISVEDLDLLKKILAGKVSVGDSFLEADMDGNGVLNNTDFNLLANVVAKIEGTYDFGGMFGSPGGPSPWTYPNPTTGGYFCPAGYVTIMTSWAPGVDWPVFYCVRNHIAGISPDYDFGGMFSYSPQGYVNPITKAFSCPSTYNVTSAAGMPNVDAPLFYCWRKHLAGRDPDYDFGGIFGKPHPGTADPGYFLAQIYGTAFPFTDNPMAFAYRTHNLTIVQPQFTPLYGMDAPNSFTTPKTFAPFSFPSDELAHNVTSEWWYLNGHLTAGYGKESYDFMTNFFTFNMQQKLGQFLFSLTAPGINKNYSYSYNNSPNSFSTGTGSLALDYHSPTGDNTFTRVSNDRAVYKLHINNPKDNVSLDLKLTAVKPPVPIGKKGYVAFTDAVSAYYAQPRLFVEGTLFLQGKVNPVDGIAWLDREWGNFDQKKTTWKWFSLQLDDNQEVEAMIVYDKATGAQLFEFLNYIDAKGQVAYSEFVDITNKDYWVSPASKIRYSSGWDIISGNIAGGIQLTVTPKIKAQEFNIGQTILWEGSCAVSGSINGKSVTGEGYTELTKYEN